MYYIITKLNTISLHITYLKIKDVSATYPATGVSIDKRSKTCACHSPDNRDKFRINHIYYFVKRLYNLEYKKIFEKFIKRYNPGILFSHYISEGLKSKKELYVMEDEKIIELYYHRSENAIAETARKYGKMIYAISYNILKNKENSEECVNDTYHTAWNKIPPANPPYFPAFLGRIARNISFDKYDYNNAAKRNADFELELSELENCLVGKDSTEEAFECKELAKHISTFLRKTGYIKRVVFVRRYWYCDSIAQISQDFRFSESKTKSMLLRTRNELKKYLERRGVTV